MASNKMDQRKLRKYEHNLVISGAGIILFGTWSVVKAAIFFLATPLGSLPDYFTDDLQASLEDAQVPDVVVIYFVVAFILLFLLLGLMLRLFIGRAAIQEGRRIRRRRPVYIVLAIVVGIGLVSSTIIRFLPGQKSGMMWEGVAGSPAVSVFVDATSLLCVVELVVSAIMVRRLRREAE